MIDAADVHMKRKLNNIVEQGHKEKMEPIWMNENIKREITKRHLYDK